MDVEVRWLRAGLALESDTAKERLLLLTGYRHSANDLDHDIEFGQVAPSSAVRTPCGWAAKDGGDLAAAN